MVRLSVADTGGGMSDEVQAHLFEPFYTTKGVHGTGLGLAIVNGIVSRIGGRIEVASREGQGTVVDITMPSSELAPEERVDDPPVSRSCRSNAVGHGRIGRGQLQLFEQPAHDVFTHFASFNEVWTRA